MEVLLCKNCKHSKSRAASLWDLYCANPIVNSNDPCFLASGDSLGTGCRQERESKWFAKCGIKGKLFEPKDTQ